MRTARQQARPKRAPKRKTAPATPDPEAMMAAWQRAATPGEGHRRLEPLVGTFHTRTTFTMQPGEEPQVSEGRSVHRWILGGRYIEQAYEGGSMGMPFSGLGFTGFDNAQGKYVGTWMDTFGTGLMHSVGVGKPTDAEIAFSAVVCDPSGQRKTFSCKVRIQDHDHHSYEMWTRGSDGKLFKTMQVDYTRQ